MEATAVPNRLHAHYAATADAYAPGSTVFLRLDTPASAPLAGVALLSAGGHPCALSVQWTELARLRLGEAREGLRLSCHLLEGGVLYTVRAVVADVGMGALPRVRLAADEQCVAIRLRQHVRYSALGSGEVADVSGAPICRFDSPRRVDISTGGFGMETEAGAWRTGAQLRYELELYVERDGQPCRELPCLKLGGLAVLRSVTRLSGAERIRLGCQFDGPAGQQQSELDFWLGVHSAYLRRA